MCATAPRSLVLVARGTPHSLTHSLTHSLARSLASPSLGGARSPWTTGPSSMAASKASSHRQPSSRPFCVLRRTSSSGCSALCSPHGRTDRAAVAATLADGAAEARGSLSSTAAGQRRGRARPPPGPGKPPRRCRLSQPSPTDPSCDLLQSLKKRTPGTSCSNSGKGKVLTAKSMTQMNSADKDPFAVNLLNLWKFIVIHRKFVK